MCDEAHGVAPVDATASELKIAAPASGNAAKLHLTLARAGLGVALSRSQRQPDVSLDDFTNRAESALSLCTLRAG